MVSDVFLRCLAVGLGGALGSMGRYGLSVWGASLGSRVPFGTLVANVVGCLAIGVLAHVAMHRAMPEFWRLFLLVGLLGGLTTFSTFSHEGATLFRQGHVMLAGLYVLGSLAMGLVGAGIGWWVASLASGGSLSS